MIFKHIVKLERGHHVPRIESAVDDVSGDRHPHLRHGSCDPLPAKRPQRVAGKAVWNVQAQIFEIAKSAQRAGRMNDAPVAARKRERTNVAELILKIPRGVILDRP